MTEPESIKKENVAESTTDTQQASVKTEQVVDDKTDKQTNDNDDKEV